MTVPARRAIVRPWRASASRRFWSWQLDGAVHAAGADATFRSGRRRAADRLRLAGRLGERRPRRRFRDLPDILPRAALGEARLAHRGRDDAGAGSSLRRRPGRRTGYRARRRGASSRRISAPGASSRTSGGGFFTGYYEPEVEGSLTQGGTLPDARPGRPPDLVTLAPERGRRHASRACPGRGARPMAASRPIPTGRRSRTGALDRLSLALLYLADPIDRFFLQVQGSGRVRLPDGRVVRLAYDGRNGQPYTAHRPRHGRPARRFRAPG